jgi:hypothetical protein
MSNQTKRLSTKEAAAVLGYSPYTLRNWRRGCKQWHLGLPGPKFSSVHGRIFYLMEALEDWQELCGTERNFEAHQGTGSMGKISR